MTDTGQVRGWSIARRTLRIAAVVTIALMALAIVADLVQAIAALSGGNLLITLPTRVVGSVVGGDNGGGVTPVRLPVVTAVTLSIGGAPAVAVIADSLSAIIGGVAVGGLAGLLLSWLNRARDAMPFRRDLARLILTAAIVLAAGWLAADILSWISAAALAGTRYTIAAHTYETTGEVLVPNFANLAFAGVLAVVGWLTRLGYGMKQELESVI